MKKITPKAILAASIALLVPTFAVQAYTYQPTITDITQVSTKYPVPHDVNWTISEQAEDGDKTIDHFYMIITNVIDDTVMCEVDEIGADVLTYRVNKSTCPDINVFNYYDVDLYEVYTDDTESNVATDTFRTKPPKAKSLKIRNKQANSVRVKFSRGVQVAGTYIYVDYIVSRKNKAGSIVLNGDEYTNDNYIDIDGLPANKGLQVKLRLRASSYGNSPWSAWEKFRTLED